jgi:hypothetical protein
MATKLITEKELDEVWKPSENLQSVKKSKAINEAQELQLYKILGEDFYNEIITQVDGDTVTAENQLVIDRSKKVIAYWAEWYALDTIYANGYNKGHLTPNAEYGDASDRAVVKDQKRVANQKADEYTLRLIKFINDNIGDYPLYSSKEEPTKNLRMSGFVFATSENKEKNSVLNKTKDNI